MNVSDAVASRRSIRRFRDEAPDDGLLRTILAKAQRAPSGGNVQPWNAHVLRGPALERLLTTIAAVIPEGRAAYAPEYAVYPAELDGAYEASRFAVGEAMYAALGITRDDKAGRLGQFARNFQAFGAPVLMLVHLPRYMGPPQWADTGMWLQTVMLLLREAGLDSCAQEAWAAYQQQIRTVVPIPDDHILFCGMAIGYAQEDAPVNQFSVARRGLEEVVTFL